MASENDIRGTIAALKARIPADNDQATAHAVLALVEMALVDLNRIANAMEALSG